MNLPKDRNNQSLTIGRNYNIGTFDNVKYIGFENKNILLLKFNWNNGSEIILIKRIYEITREEISQTENDDTDDEYVDDE
uniref:Uncharacterized protein n=1 Tax=viral metagenome TaxID=1070528 RepID=A0A6C0DC64_9ZZZZ